MSDEFDKYHPKPYQDASELHDDGAPVSQHQQLEQCLEAYKRMCARFAQVLMDHESQRGWQRKLHTHDRRWLASWQEANAAERASRRASVLVKLSEADADALGVGDEWRSIYR